MRMLLIAVLLLLALGAHAAEEERAEFMRIRAGVNEIAAVMGWTDVTVNFKITKTTKSYYGTTEWDIWKKYSSDVRGEDITCVISYKAPNLFVFTYSFNTNFPDTLKKNATFVSPTYNFTDFYFKLLASTTNTFSLLRITHSNDDSAREAAVMQLTDQVVLAILAVEDKNTDVRKAAVAKLTDQPLLAKLAVEDKYEFVRMVAVKNLTAQVLLAKVAVEDEYEFVRMEAVKNLTDQGMLAYAAVVDNSWFVREAAVEKLTDQVLLASRSVVDDSWSVRFSAEMRLKELKTETGENDSKSRTTPNFFTDEEREEFKRLRAGVNEIAVAMGWTDVTVNFKITKTSKLYEGRIIRDNGVRESAIVHGEDIECFISYKSPKLFEGAHSFARTIFPSKLNWNDTFVKPDYFFTSVYSQLLASPTEISSLVKISQCNDASVREAAVLKLTDQALLTRVAMEDKDDSVRLGATGLSQGHYTQVALKDTNRDVRLAAVMKLTDQAVLTKVAVEDKDKDVRLAAVVRLTDQAVLAKVAVADKDRSVRFWGVMKLTDQAVLARVVLEDKDVSVRKAAVVRLTDQAVLAKVAVADKDKSVRFYGVMKLTDQAVLAKVAVADKDKSVRFWGVMKLTDQAVLAKVAVKDKDVSVRKAAVENLTDQAVLAKVAAEDEDRDVRNAAKIRLNALQAK